MLRFTLHAAQRMVQWNLDVISVERTLTHGEVIETYPDDTPFPSRLVLGWDAIGPIHVVTATSTTEEIVITAYRPDPVKWDATYRVRRESR